MLRTSILVAALGVSITARLAAQCPDGTPPPCGRGSMAGTVPARRPNPPLDEHTWIILPFENVARAQDIEWLKDASVNLLYLDMSKWRDIRVVDDERVADLIREVPEARAGLTLQSGMAVARRAGAGKLVMGDLLKVGSRTQIVAKVYDVRTGQRVRNVREETANPDSLMGLFGRLARGILNAGAPTGGAVLGTGTTRLDAYQAYVAGIAALNRVDLDSAQAHFERAIALDSTFALAHYKLSVVFGWLSPADARRVSHAEQANRLAVGLPPRERQLILGQNLTAHGQWAQACATYHELLRADSSDVEAWYNLGECSFHDQGVVPLAGDTSRLVFRGSWNTALRAFQRALEIDPTYHLAYAHIPDILLVDQRTGCRARDVITNCTQEEQYLAYLLRDGDSLVTNPVRFIDAFGRTRQADEALRQQAWVANHQRNRASAQAWVNAGPDEPRAHLALARALLRTGSIDEAAREFNLARTARLSAADASRALLDRFELLFKMDSLQAVARLADSLAARPPRRNIDLGGLGAIQFGRWNHLESVFGTNPVPPPVRAALLATFKVMQGAPPADLVALELSIDSMLATVPPAAQRANRTFFFTATMPWTLSLPRPAALRNQDTTDLDLPARMAFQMIRGDTAAARSSLARLDAEALAAPRELPVAIALQWAAEGWLWLGDTATALARLREFERRLPYLNPLSNYLQQLGNLAGNMQTWGRTYLRLADAAASQGDRATAARNYRRVIDLWSNADPAFQPIVQRAREALARFGP